MNIEEILKMRQAIQRGDPVSASDLREGVVWLKADRDRTAKITAINRKNNIRLRWWYKFRIIRVTWRIYKALTKKGLWK